MTSATKTPPPTKATTGDVASPLEIGKASTSAAKLTPTRSRRKSNAKASRKVKAGIKQSGTIVRKKVEPKPVLRKKRQRIKPAVVTEVAPEQSPEKVATPTSKTVETVSPNPEEQRASEDPPPGITRLQAVLGLIRRGHDQGLPMLRALFDDAPDLYRHYGDVARTARFAWAKLAADDDPLIRESIFRAAEELKSRYSLDPDACPTEEMLVEQIVVCWLRANYYQLQDTRQSNSNNTKLVSLTLRRHEQAQNQLFKAIDQLEMFRRLKVA